MRELESVAKAKETFTEDLKEINIGLIFGSTNLLMDEKQMMTHMIFRKSSTEMEILDLQKKMKVTVRTLRELLLPKEIMEKVLMAFPIM